MELYILGTNIWDVAGMIAHSMNVKLNLFCQKNKKQLNSNVLNFYVEI